MINLPQSIGLNLPHIYNIRDIGGYPTKSGKITRRRTFIRSESLGRISPKSQQALIDYGIRTIVDLRKISETIDDPNVFLDSSVVYYHHQDMVGNMVFHEKPPDVEHAKHVSESYSQILDQRKTSIGQILSTLASPNILPAIYHCAGGQDRTGIISALLLGLAGVPENMIAEDFALTARYQINHYLSEDRPNETIPDGYSIETYLSERCHPKSMSLTIRYMNENYGSIEGYVKEAGLNGSQIDSIRSALVE